MLNIFSFFPFFLFFFFFSTSGPLQSAGILSVLQSWAILFFKWWVILISLFDYKASTMAIQSFQLFCREWEPVSCRGPPQKLRFVILRIRVPCRIVLFHPACAMQMQQIMKISRENCYKNDMPTPGFKPLTLNIGTRN